MSSLAEQYVNLFTNPSFETANGTVVTRANLCTNPNFESATTSWTAQNSTIAVSTAQHHSGSQSLLCTLNAAVSAGTYTSFTQTVGTTYTLSAWLYVPVSVTIRAAYTNATVTNGGTATTIPSGVWTRISVTGTATATSGFLSVITTVAPPAGSLMYVDDVLVEAAAAVGTYFDGNTAPDGTFAYAWSGTTNASSSTQSAASVVAVTGGYQSTAWASQGTHSLFVPAGQTATVSVAGLSTVMVTPQGAGQTVTFDSTPVTSTSGNPITATASSEVTFGPGYWDCLGILDPGYEGTYFDGSTPSATTVDGITTYTWNGAVGASTSTMSILRYYTSNFNGLTWGPGTDIQLVEIDGLRSMKTRTSDESYPEDDGALPGIDLLAERTITYKLQIAAPQTMTAEEALQACAAAFQVIRDPAGGLPLQAFLPGWVEPRQLTARPVNNDVPIDVNYSLQYLQFSVQFDCADPLIYSTTQHTASTGLPSPTAGLTFNVTFPVSFGASTGGSVQVTNAGNYASKPVITINGPCINPYVSNGTDFMQFDLQLGATDVLVIDMAAKSVTLNGTASRYNTVATGSAWWSLAPGTTTVTFESGDGSQVAATMTITWRDAWGMM